MPPRDTIVTIVAVLATACGGSTSTSATDAGSSDLATPSASPTSPAATTDAEASPAAPAGLVEPTATDTGTGDTTDYVDGRIDLTIIGASADYGVPGVAVTFTSESGEVFTATADANGQVSVSVPPAFYGVSIEPACGDVVEVLEPASAQFAVPPNEAVAGVVRLRWRHRFGPSLPTDWVGTDGQGDRREPPSWRVGVTYDVTFAVVDRCNGDAPAPDTSFDAFRFTTSDNVVVVGTNESRSDVAGIGHVQAVCSADGVIHLEMYDSINPDEPTFDLVVESGTYGRPDCRTS